MSPTPDTSVVPDSLIALVLTPDDLRALLFAGSPSQTLAGMLHTRELLGLSPYSAKGIVRNPAMFFGRQRQILELATPQGSPSSILVGPRRVGKSTLLLRLHRELQARYPERDVHYVDLLDTPPARVTARFEQLFGAATPSDEPAAAAILRAAHARDGRLRTLLIDEADQLVEVDARAGHPLLAAWHRLEQEGVCTFVLAGYWHLFRRTQDHASPLYNFGTVKELGPLEPAAALALVIEPMARLGIRFASGEIAQQIVMRTGGYPALVQAFCDTILSELRRGQTPALVITAAHVEAAEQSGPLQEYLALNLEWNAGPASRLVGLHMAERADFGLAEAHTLLAGINEIPLALTREALQMLLLFGCLEQRGDRYRWTIPMLRDSILGGDRAFLEEQARKELAGLPIDAWVTPPKRP